MEHLDDGVILEEGPEADRRVSCIVAFPRERRCVHTNVEDVADRPKLSMHGRYLDRLDGPAHAKRALEVHDKQSLRIRIDSGGEDAQRVCCSVSAVMEGGSQCEVALPRELRADQPRVVRGLQLRRRRHSVLRQQELQSR